MNVFWIYANKILRADWARAPGAGKTFSRASAPTQRSHWPSARDPLAPWTKQFLLWLIKRENGTHNICHVKNKQTNESNNFQIPTLELSSFSKVRNIAYTLKAITPSDSSCSGYFFHTYFKYSVIDVWKTKLLKLKIQKKYSLIETFSSSIFNFIDWKIHLFYLTK